MLLVDRVEPLFTDETLEIADVQYGLTNIQTGTVLKDILVNMKLFKADFFNSSSPLAYSVNQLMHEADQ